MEFNKYQTELTDEYVKTLPKEVQEQLLDILVNVEFVRRLVSPNRQYAKDRPRDEKGRIIVDLTNPHILEDMDYFRPTAIHYDKYGTLTDLKPNSNPNSAFGKWIREEKRRCWEGYVRESDGEWVTGYMYWFLNYCPIMLSKIREGSKRADRVQAMPEVWEGIYWRFHYLEQASNAGKHCAELASRSKGKSYVLASILSHVFILGENAEAHEKVTGIVTAYQKEYLIKDGVLNKFVDMANFCASHTQFPRKRLKDSMQEMTWTMGYKDAELGIERGTQNTIIGVSSKDDESKLRGKRAAKILIEEFGCHIEGTQVLLYNGKLKKVEELTTQDILMGDDGTPRHILECHCGYDDMYKITLANGDYHIVNKNHLLYYKKCNWQYKAGYRIKEITQPIKEFIQIPKTNKGYYIPKAVIKFPYKNVPIDPYFLGLWLGDGDSYRLSIANEDIEVLSWLSSNYRGKIQDLKQSETCKNFYMPTKENAGHYAAFKSLNLFKNKHVPEDYRVNSPKVQLALIAGLIDTDGTLNKKKTIFEITQRWDRKHILEDVKFMCECNGLKCHLTTRIAAGKKPGVLHYRLRITGDISIIPTKILRKQGKLHQGYRTRNNWQDYTFKVEPYGIGKYYGFMVDGNHRFVLGDLTVTHNSFPRLLDLYNVLLPSVQEGDIVYGSIYMLGTSGDSESDFAAAKEILYNPDGYNMYALPNVYDKNNQGKSKFTFFFPGYINRKGCFNKDGVSDVTKALVEILLNRYRVKYNSSDPNTIIKTIAEIPITPAEAVIRTTYNMFPVTDLTERLLQLDNDPNAFSDVYVGDLVYKGEEVIFKPSGDNPIRDFPHKENKIKGAIEIFEMPEIDKNSKKVFNSRYIAGCLVEGERVNTQRGLVPVEEVTLKDKLINIEGQQVEIYNLQKYYNESPVYRVKLSNIVDTTTFSGEHPIYCCTKKIHYHPSYYAQKHNLPYRYWTYDYAFKPVRELKVGDYVRTPILYTEEKDISSLWVENRRIDYQTENPLTYPEFWYLVGVILGDGWVSGKYEITICFNKKETWLINRCQYIIETILHRKFSLQKTKETVFEYSFCCKPFTTFFTRYFGKYAVGKYIAEPIKYMSHTFKKYLVLGYIDTDGCCNERRRGTEIVSISKKLLCDIQDILFSLGIISSIKLLRPAGEHIIAGKAHFCKDTYSLIIALIGTKAMQDWGIPSMKISNCTINIKDASHDILNVFIKDGYLNIKVKKIEVLPYNGPIYNFECATHTFMCNYIPTHNCDPIDQDQADTMSLGSIFILDLWTDRIVAEYTGRPVYAEDFHEICRKLCIFYNAKLNYENNLKGLFSYFSTHNCAHYLSDTLEFLKDKQLIKESTSSFVKGTRATLPINNYGRDRLRSWLLAPINITKGEEEVTIPRLYTLRNRALIKELINYNSIGNFDRISAMGMLMLLREDRMITYQGNPVQRKTNSASYLGNDPYFVKNYVKKD